jgi:hypothetical protein
MVDLNDFFIESKDVKLECQSYESAATPNSTVLICHPHPQYGGNMHNNVVSAVFSKLRKEHISCMRFNFRGVGSSSGIYSGEEDAIEDVKAIIDYLIEEKALKQLLICGYSYGAVVGCSTVNYSERILGFIAISFPWDLLGERYKKLSQTNKPKLFIQGDKDSIAIYDNFMKHYASYKEPKQYKIIKNASHFYRGFENSLAEEVLSFCERYIKRK